MTRGGSLSPNDSGAESSAGFLQRGRIHARRLMPNKVVRQWLTTIALGVTGGIIGVMLFANIETTIGPFDTTFSVRPSSSGSTNVNLAPLGELLLRTHSGPTQMNVAIDRIDLPRARALLDDPAAVAELEQTIPGQIRTAVFELAKKSLLLAFVGGALLALIRRLHWKSALVGGLTSLFVAGSTFGVAAFSLNDNALAEPRFTGALTLAPQAIGNVRDVTNKFGLYRDQASELVSNLSRLYETTNGTASVDVNSNAIRILHVSDLHLNPAGFDLVEQMVQQFKPTAIIDTGDINDWGTSFESSYADRIARLGVPYIFIRGNHDSPETEASVAVQPNAVVLDNTSTNVEGLRVWGSGDPRFTADKSTYEDLEAEKAQADAAAPEVLRQLLASQPPDVDVVLVHDPSTAALLGDRVPLVLAGHLHKAEHKKLGLSTDLMIQGSTGGAGLRGVNAEGKSVPLQCSMLYFDRDTRRLVASDHVTVEGLGGSGAQIDRRITGVVEPEPEAEQTTTSTIVDQPPASTTSTVP